MSGWLWRGAGVLVALGIGGFLVAASGVVPLRASSGHWGITEFLLHFGMRRSVSTWSLGTQAPPLEDPALVLKGAGQYAAACQACHGAPGEPPSLVARQAAPHPPSLPAKIHEWEPAELFYIVKHGVKFTGMPAWPALERDDEVWSMVAFLRVLPSLTPEVYRRLALGDGAEGVPASELEDLSALARPVLESCARCHGPSGEGRGVGAFPRLSGQRPAYLAAALRAYAAGERHSGIMESVAVALDDETVDELARWYARRGDVATPPPDLSLRDAGGGGGADGPPPPLPVGPAVLRRGETLARRGVPDRKIPACVACHGPGARPRNPFYPDLAGQYARYLVLQLRLFSQDVRGGSPYAHLMDPAAHHLEPEEREAVAAWYASLGGAVEAPTLPPATGEGGG